LNFIVHVHSVKYISETLCSCIRVYMHMIYLGSTRPPHPIQAAVNILLHQRMSVRGGILGVWPSKRHNSSTRKVFLRVLISKLHVVVTVRKNASLSKIPVR